MAYVNIIMKTLMRLKRKISKQDYRKPLALKNRKETNVFTNETEHVAFHL